MTFISAVMVGTSVFLMLICSSESKPKAQAVDTTDLGNADFLDKLAGLCSAKCVPLNKCCDVVPSTSSSSAGSPLNGFDERNIIADINKPNPKSCGQLQLCCDKTCSDRPTVDRSNQCGIRNSKGVGITVNGFKNGQSQYGEFPWMVAVYTDGKKYVGGGSLIHPKVVLSAGHKISDQEKKNINLVARLGEWDNAHNNEEFAPQNIAVVKIMYPDAFHRPTHEHNIALLFLEKEAVITDTVMPICLPAPNHVFTDGTNCIVTGWGKDTFEGAYQSIMKAATVPVINNVQCEGMLRTTRLGPSFELHESMNCAGGTKEDACEGDGGSPLVCPKPDNPNEYVQMGIVSWGIGCGIEGNPGVYASVPKAVEWINKAIDTEINFTSVIDERRPEVGTLS